MIWIISYLVVGLLIAGGVVTVTTLKATDKKEVADVLGLFTGVLVLVWPIIVLILLNDGIINLAWYLKTKKEGK